MLGLVSSEEGRVPRASSLSQPREDTREDGRGSPEPDPAAALIDPRVASEWKALALLAVWKNPMWSVSMFQFSLVQVP